MMVKSQNGSKLSPEIFKGLRDLIYDKSGIFFPEAKLYLLEGRLTTRLRDLGLSDFRDYFTYIKRVSVQAEELIKLYSLITINETYFFRYPKQLDIFDKRLLPEFISRHPDEKNKKLKIWSTASSSGEELFTLAIMIRELLGKDVSNWDIDLKGTDISERMLELARQAEYGHNSFRGKLEGRYLSRYFKQNGERYQVNQNIKNMASFDYLNLRDINSIRKQRGLDFIFCRNVLIYFDREMKKRVVDAFYEILNHGGYLFLGEAESLHGVSSSFKVEHFPSAFVYKKE